MMDDKATQLHKTLLSDGGQSGDEVEVKRRRKGHTKRIRRPSSARFIFDDFSSQQSEDLLRQHGKHATYLVSHFHDPQSYQLVIRFDEPEGLVFKHYAMGLTGEREVFVEGIQGKFKSLEDGILAVEEELSTKLSPIFDFDSDEDTDFLSSDSISISQEVPPEYVPAQKYPEAPRKQLPFIVPIRPTLRRLQNATLTNSLQRESDYNTVPESEVHHGCCWRLCHTDPRGQWYKPHKAGPCMAVVLVIGWFFFLLLFGWIIALALLLVGILVMCAYTLNFVCTGRCTIDDDDD
ncbi:PREDICTED: uncharacterized protein LOC100634091 [Amphimedon queenslandica]|nr:PREDICTED: uncharacterized protein LOC100634091 [Amphimedon queenslandica]|eukprot:XP_003382854.2 PREDICTED: uncharacterized protein LOC100634091 [Amphimedon queenslandica]